MEIKEVKKQLLEGKSVKELAKEASLPVALIAQFKREVKPKKKQKPYLLTICVICGKKKKPGNKLFCSRHHYRYEVSKKIHI